jgi:hypothetical protein
MYITMQGNWKVSVKSKSAAFPQQFVISGAVSGNGTYVGATITPPVHVTGSLWTINIQNNPGSGFQNSDARIKFPSIIGGKIVFDIESNDAGGDQDFNDLILTCSTPKTGSDYVMYGNVSCYSDSCHYNPCFRDWLVIESQAALEFALKNPALANAIKQLYPERIPPVIVNPNPPDPGPFKPIMINLASTSQAAGRVVDVYEKLIAEQPIKTGSAKGSLASADAENAETPQDFKLSNSIPVAAKEDLKSSPYDLSALAKLKAPGIRRLCFKDQLPFITLDFTDYDRTFAELHGSPYAGNGDRTPLGSTMTDMNGNYIFRFTRSIWESLEDVLHDVALGENQFGAYRPDVIVSVPNSIPGGPTLYESAPHWNISNLYHLNLCFPCRKIRSTIHCFNGNLIGGLGNVAIGGTQNTTGSTLPANLDRNQYGNHLHHDGTVSVQILPNQAGFHATSACWFGLIDWKGCMYNLQRQPGDPMISHYTIRFKKPGGSWQFVNEAYTHRVWRNNNPSNYTGDLVGPFPMTLNVDAVPTPDVPAYKNIQKELFHDGIAWEFPDIDRFMQMNSSIYEGGTPGTVYFMVEGYDAAGNLVPGAKDLIALFIDNSFINYSLDNVWFTDDGVNVIKSDCNLYRMTDAHLNSPLHITFKANDSTGFIEKYTLGFSKCGAAFGVNELMGGMPKPDISFGINPTVGDTFSYDPYYGTAESVKFGDANSHTIEYTPKLPNTKWLNPDEYYTMLFVSLNVSKRQTNGYNKGVYDASGIGAVVAVERIS